MTSRNSGPDSYYGRPVLKEPVWTWEVPVYFFFGGLAGASSVLAAGSELAGNEELARRAWGAAMAGVVASPPLLVADLGRPERFLNMLRVFKLTSPMSVGAWVLFFEGGAVSAAAGSAWTGRWRPLGRAAGVLAAALGLPLATYTAVLVADTAVPAWHEARRELPWVFAGSAMASAGGAGALSAPVAVAGPARRLAIIGAVVELMAVRRLDERLGELAAPYHEGRAGKLGRAAKTLTAVGAAALAWRGGRDRRVAAAGGVMLLAGALCERELIFDAGRASAREPRYTVEPQRARRAAAAA